MRIVSKKFNEFVLFNQQMEAEALIELLCSEYPRAKFWISFQCKVGKNRIHIFH